LGTCIAKIAHEECGSHDALQTFLNDDGSISGYCFACSTYVPHPYGENTKIMDIPLPKKKTEEEIQQEIAEIDGYQTVDIPHKRLKASSLDYFDVKVGLSEVDGKTPELIYYPYTKGGKLSGYKVKLLNPKKLWSIGDLKGVDAFGWEKAIAVGAKRLIVTEGEDDTIAWHRILELMSKDEFKDFTAVVSVPHGASSAREFFSEHGKDLNEYFKEVYLSFDMDAAGRKAVEEVSLVYPKAKSISLPSKDANQCIIDGKMKAAFNALFNATKPKNSRLIFGEDVHEAAKEPAKYGELTWPWEHIQRDTRGIRYGETIYIGGGVNFGAFCQ